MLSVALAAVPAIVPPVASTATVSSVSCILWKLDENTGAG
jgi:hypothetical protein